MARDWRDLFIVDSARVAEGSDEPVQEERRRGMFRRLRENLSKTREALGAEVRATLFEGDLDAATWSGSRRP